MKQEDKPRNDDDNKSVETPFADQALKEIGKNDVEFIPGLD